MRRLQERAQNVPAVIRGAAFTAALGTTLYWSFTYSGPYRWAAEWQLRETGSYDVTMTGILLGVALLIVAAVAVQLIAIAYVGPDTPEASAELAARREATEAWIVGHRFRLIGVVATVGFLGVGAYGLIKGLTARGLTKITAASLEAGDAPQSSYVEIEGDLQMDALLAIEEKHQSTTITKVYIPLVSRGHRAGQPVKVFLETYDTWLSKYKAALSSGRHSGILSEGSLPGIARTGFEERGILPKSGYWVLDYRKTPEELLDFGLVFAVVGLASGILTGVVWLLKARAERARSVG